jgi:hypothetical protein
MSLKRAADLCYDLPPADERKGETGDESDRHLGNPIVIHRSTIIGHPAGTMTGSRRRTPQEWNYRALARHKATEVVRRRNMSRRTHVHYSMGPKDASAHQGERATAMICTSSRAVHLFDTMWLLPSENRRRGQI